MCSVMSGLSAAAARRKPLSLDPQVSRSLQLWLLAAKCDAVTANNPSESIIAKRRGYGTIVSHNVPPYGRAGLYKQLAELQAMVTEYREDPGSNQVLRRPMLAALQSSGEHLVLTRTSLKLWLGASSFTLLFISCQHCHMCSMHHLL